jgi:hypothetical protein
MSWWSSLGRSSSRSMRWPLLALQVGSPNSSSFFFKVQTICSSSPEREGSISLFVLSDRKFLPLYMIGSCCHFTHRKLPLYIEHLCATCAADVFLVCFLRSDGSLTHSMLVGFQEWQFQPVSTFYRLSRSTVHRLRACSCLLTVGTAKR